MNKAKLKSYAPQAGRDFIAAITARANQLGIGADEIGFIDKYWINQPGDIKDS